MEAHLNNSFSSNLVGIAGQTGSGKTTLAQELKKTLQAELVSFGAFVRAQALERGLSLERSTLLELGETLIEEHGPEEFVARVVLFHLRDVFLGHQPTLLVVEGIRHVEIWEAIQRQYQKTYLVYLDVPETIRVRRVQERDSIDSASAFKILHHSMEKGVRKLLSRADLVVKQGNPRSTAKIIQGIIGT